MAMAMGMGTEMAMAMARPSLFSLHTLEVSIKRRLPYYACSVSDCQPSRVQTTLPCCPAYPTLKLLQGKQKG